MIRARFYIKKKDCGNDYRPVKWPIKYPYWCTGESSDCFIIVAYADNVEQIMELWPEACFIEPKEVDAIEFTSRFPKPKWYNKEEQTVKKKQMIMKKTYKITLPKGANISTVETNESNDVLEVTVGIEKKYEPKDGDVVSCNGIIVIYAGTNETGGIMTYAALHGQRLQTVVSERGWGYTSDYRPANEAEKQLLFNALAEQGKRWNAEKKCIEDLPRWRTKRRRLYYYIVQDRLVLHKEEARETLDNHNYELGNYFRTREAAEKVAEQIRDIFKNSKAE